MSNTKQQAASKAMRKWRLKNLDKCRQYHREYMQRYRQTPQGAERCKAAEDKYRLKKAAMKSGEPK